MVPFVNTLLLMVPLSNTLLLIVSLSGAVLLMAPSLRYSSTNGTLCQHISTNSIPLWCSHHLISTFLLMVPLSSTLLLMELSLALLY